MHIGFDQPWFILLWIVLLAILLLPIIVGGVNAVVNNYFQAKEKHFGRIAKAFAEVFKEGLAQLESKKKENQDSTDENSR